MGLLGDESGLVVDVTPRWLCDLRLYLFSEADRAGLSALPEEGLF